MKKISIVIPSFNEKEYLHNLLSSIEHLDYPKDAFEVIIISDGSTDGTPQSVSEHFPKFKIIDLPKNIGRYHARKFGVEEATFEYILFLDSRTLVEQNILRVINETDYCAIKGRVITGNRTNPFHVFFESIRYKIYPRFYTRNKVPFEINETNFESLPKGTGVFFASKSVLLSAFKELEIVHMGKIASDDTLLIETICKHTPVLYHPEVRITHFIRSTFTENFLHLIYRGSTFVFYYLDLTKRLFWLVLIIPPLLVLLLLGSLIIIAPPWYLIFGLLIGFLTIIALYLANTAQQFLTIFYMIPVCLIAFYFGVFRGIVIRILKIE